MIRRAHSAFLSGFALCLGAGLAWLAAVSMAQEETKPAATGDAGDEVRIFEAALAAFGDGFYQRADREFGQWMEQFSQSSRYAAAVLYRARALHELGRFQEAADLLRSEFDRAGELADRYQFRVADALLAGGQYLPAAEAFETVTTAYPESPLRGEAAYGEAFALFHAGQVNRTVEILKEDAGTFKQSIQNNANPTLSLKGHLLLAEALRTQQAYAAAEAALKQVAGIDLSAADQWELDYRRARIELAEGKSEAALERANRLVQLASATGQPTLEAESLRLKAQILEVADPEKAVEAYEQITQIKDLPPEEQRKSLLKLVDLSTTANQLTHAIERLETFIERNSADVAMDILRLDLGELYLKSYYSVAPEDKPGTRGPVSPSVLDLLQKAHLQFGLVITNFPQSSSAPKALLNRGYCFWEEGRITQQQDNYRQGLEFFQAATERLPHSDEQAAARFKWADCQFLLQDYSGAVKNYRALIEQYGDVPTVKDEFFERALYQIVQAALAMQDFAEARAATAKLVEWFPGGGDRDTELGDNALLLFGEALLKSGKPAEARAEFRKVLQNYPGSSLKVEADLAVARTFVKEADWAAAIQQYEAWSNTYTNAANRPRVAFDQAWVYAQAGRQTNALELFSRFVTSHPEHALAPMAQFWVGNYHFQTGDYYQAEINYQNRVLLRTTNVVSPDLPYEARLMAARAAFRREGFTDARGYLTGLINDKRLTESTNLARRIVPEAFFLLGEIFVKEPVRNSTNVLDNFAQALNAFNFITNFYADHSMAPVAMGRIGDCHTQLAALRPSRYQNAADAYRMAMASPLADISVRSQAEVGLGLVLARQAEQRPTGEKKALLNQALDHFLNVFYGRNVRSTQGEREDPFWLHKAGTEAARVAEQLGLTEEAVSLYRALQKMIPIEQAHWQERIDALAGLQ